MRSDYAHGKPLKNPDLLLLIWREWIYYGECPIESGQCLHEHAVNNATGTIARVNLHKCLKAANLWLLFAIFRIMPRFTLDLITTWELNISAVACKELAYLILLPGNHMEVGFSQHKTFVQLRKLEQISLHHAISD